MLCTVPTTVSASSFPVERWWIRVGLAAENEAEYRRGTRPFVSLRVGDQLRALGDRGPDGSRLAAEQVVFGTFQTVSGTITAVDGRRNEVTMRAEESRRTLTVAVGPEARVRRLPPEMGAWLARAGGGGSEDLLERMPVTTLAELKAGDRVLVASAEGSDPARLNAIALVAGLEALRPAAASGRTARGPDVGLPGDLLDLGMGNVP